MNATFGASMSQYLDTVGHGLTAQLSENSAERVAGRISTAAPVKVMSGESYTLDVEFSTSVTRVAPGTALPPGGGDPGQALKALDLAVTERTWPAIRTALTAERLEAFDKSYNTPEENLDYAVDILRAWLPKSGLVVVGGELRGDTAILEVEGEAFSGSKGFYVARMSKAGTAWLFDTATMVGLLP